MGCIAISRRRSPPQHDSHLHNDEYGHHHYHPAHSAGLDVLGVSAHPPHYDAAGQVSVGAFDSYPSNEATKDRLVKQTYSVLVHLPDKSGPESVRKWHMSKLVFFLIFWFGIWNPYLTNVFFVCFGLFLLCFFIWVQQPHISPRHPKCKVDYEP